MKIQYLNFSGGTSIGDLLQTEYGDGVVVTRTQDVPSRDITFGAVFMASKSPIAADEPGIGVLEHISSIQARSTEPYLAPGSVVLYIFN